MVRILMSHEYDIISFANRNIGAHDHHHVINQVHMRTEIPRWLSEGREIFYDRSKEEGVEFLIEKGLVPLMTENRVTSAQITPVFCEELREAQDDAGTYLTF